MNIDTTRRSFLRGAVAAVAVSPVAFAKPLPVLVGDGIHDDTAALQAFVDGESFIAVTPEMASGLVLQNGRFRITAPIRLGPKASGLLWRSTEVSREHDGAFFEIAGAKDVFITRNIFRGVYRYGAQSSGLLILHA